MKMSKEKKDCCDLWKEEEEEQQQRKKMMINSKQYNEHQNQFGSERQSLVHSKSRLDEKSAKISFRKQRELQKYEKSDGAQAEKVGRLLQIQPRQVLKELSPNESETKQKSQLISFELWGSSLCWDSLSQLAFCCSEETSLEDRKRNPFQTPILKIHTYKTLPCVSLTAFETHAISLQVRMEV